MTLGLLAVSATGGALLGYGVRARQYPLAGQPAGDGTATLEADTAGRQRVIDGERIERTVQSTKPKS
jgi:hypothetical protein